MLLSLRYAIATLTHIRYDTMPYAGAMPLRFRCFFRAIILLPPCYADCHAITVYCRATIRATPRRACRCRYYADIICHFIDAYLIAYADTLRFADGCRH